MSGIVLRLLLPVLLLLTACSAGSDQSAVGEPAVGAPPAPVVQRDLDHSAEDGAGASGGGSGYTKEVLTPVVPDPSRPVDPALAGRDVVRTGQVTVQVEAPSEAASRLRQRVGALGGFVSAERMESSTDEDHTPSVSLTLRVPVRDFDAVVSSLSELGEVRHLEVAASDVTGEVVDVESRLASQRASVERVRSLLAEASSLADVVTIEAELSRRQADLESLEARLASLKDRSSLSTLEVYLSSGDQADVFVEEEGFFAGLRAGWDAFTSALTAGLTVLGALTPFLLVLLPVLYFFARHHRRTRRSRSGESLPE